MKEKECTRCGVVRTPENTYLRKGKYLMNICKKCNSEICKERRYKNMTGKQRAELLKKHEEVRKLLKNMTCPFK